MNAVELFAERLPLPAVRRLATLRVQRFERALFGELGPAPSDVIDNDEARARIFERWRDDLCGFLNALTKPELAALALAVGERARRTSDVTDEPARSRRDVREDGRGPISRTRDVRDEPAWSRRDVREDVRGPISRASDATDEPAWPHRDAPEDTRITRSRASDVRVAWPDDDDARDDDDAGAGDEPGTPRRRSRRAGATSAELRARLWELGAAHERGDHVVADAVQPRPVLLGGHLVVQAPPRGPYPPSTTWPRPLPPPAIAAPPIEEPETIDELLAAADRAIGVRLGRRGRDKGAWGSRAQALLGVDNLGDDEPDWRGDVEIKTVAIAREPSGLWRVVEDPAIAMVGDGVIAKLQRTLWLARASIPATRTQPSAATGAGDDATIVSWYLLDWDAEIARLARRYLHERPKGPRGTDARGLYLSKRFFADAGLLASLNGAA